MHYSLVRQWAVTTSMILYTYACISDDETFAGYHFTSFDNPLLDPEEIRSS
jgi:hypothetical protein